MGTGAIACFGTNVQASAPNIQFFCFRWSRVHARVTHFAIPFHRFHYWKYIRSIFIAAQRKRRALPRLNIYIHRMLGTRNNCYNFRSFYELIAKWPVTAHSGNELLLNSLSFRATTTYRFVFQVSGLTRRILFTASLRRFLVHGRCEIFSVFLVRNCFLVEFVLNCRVSFYLTQCVTQASVCLVSVHGARCSTMQCIDIRCLRLIARLYFACRQPFYDKLRLPGIALRCHSCGFLNICEPTGSADNGNPK